MAKQLRPSQLEALLSGDLNGNEFFAIHRIGYNYSLTLDELKKFIGIGGSGGGSDIDLTSVASNIVPDSNGSRILGNAENAWQRLFLTESIRFTSKGIIYGNVDVQGALTLNGKALAMQSSITNIADIVDNLDARIEKIESGEDVDLSDYYTKGDVDDILKNYTTTSVLQTDYVSVRGDYTITGTHTYNDGKLKVGQYAFGAGSSGIAIDGHLIKTSGNSYSNSEIDNMIASVSTASKLGGMLNITDKTAIQNAQKLLTSTNQVAYYIITDSSGKLPSKQTCFDLSADNIKQLSLTSPNALTNAALSLVHGSVAVSPIGVNVGDMIALTRVKVKVADLTAALGVSLGLSGDIEMYQYRIISFNDAKAPKTNGIANGVMGLMTPSDKAEVSKIGGIEWTANHVRDNYLPKADVLPSIWGTNMNDCLNTGVYPWCTLGRPSGSTGAYTCIVKRTSTNDGSYDTIEQTAYGREGESGRVFKRIIFQHKNGSDTQYGDWIELGGGSVDLSSYATQSWVRDNFLTKMTIDSVPTAGSSNLVTSGGVLSTIAALEELCDTTYLKKTGGTINGSLSINGLLNIGSNYIRGNGDRNILDSQGEWVILGYDMANVGLPTYIDGNEIYLRYGKGHAYAVKIGSDGNTRVYGNLNVSGSACISGHAYIGGADNTDYKALLLRRSGNGLRINATENHGYISYGPLNAAKDEITPNAIIRFNNGELTYSPNNVNYYDILTSNSLKIGEYAFQDRTENRLASTTDLNNVSYGVWGTIDNTTYTNAPIQNFGLIVSRLNQAYKGQLLLPYYYGNIYYRAQGYEAGAIKWSPWRKLAFTDDLSSYIKDGDTINALAMTTLQIGFNTITADGNKLVTSSPLHVKGALTALSLDRSTYSQVATHEDLGAYVKQDTIPDLDAIRSNAANGNTAFGWGDHALKGYATQTYTINKINELIADKVSGLPSYAGSLSGSQLQYLNMHENQANPAEITSKSAVYYIVDKQCFYIVSDPNIIGSAGAKTHAYSVFDGSAFYNSSATSARKDCLFYNTTTKTVHRIGDSSVLTMVDSGNIETILSGKYLGKNDTATSAKMLVSNSGNHVLYVDGNGYPTSNNILLFKNAAGSSNFGYVGRPNDTGLYVMTYGSSPIIFGTNSAERLRIDHNGNILIANDKMIFFNHANEGAYMYGTGISWHNSSNAWTKTLMAFSSDGTVNFPNSATIEGNNILTSKGGTVEYLTTSMLNGYSLIGTSSGLTLSGYFSATRFYEDGTSLAEKYLSKSSDTVTGTLTFNGTSTYHLREASTTPKWYIGKDGYATFAYVVNTSDANMKNLMGDVNLSVNQIANAPAKYFTWKNNIQLGRQVGTVAQYWRDVLPEVVMENEGLLGLNYASLAVVSSIILARNIETHEQRIARLEKEIATLTDELNSLVGKV